MTKSVYASFLKSAFDVAVGIILGLLLLPLFAILALAIRLDSPGAPIFTQLRVGKNLKPFRIYKLRTMVKNAQSIGPGSTSQNDSRITRIGNFLRKTSLDELPQVYNLALGHMSLIGPRPGLAAERRFYSSDKDYLKRHSVKPGISGLAQATYRSSATFDQRLAADLFYADNISPSLDFKIILDTLKILRNSRAGN